mmetsp:Transcript_9746/g.15670  ORF Transcript_9746/g.15670 Transcript_9746/m.15670 type:complete len:146 (-) Transcript_9746:368-805(-)|eukprot:CAMPEP_0197040218 /NCGR_PEP_ID=MMETSP1384-20130603/16957_1 /TAXON_ID=29189 /ORGANISM="Ammonia sp." /LENGTH=145 /DNA_ID=CAMNT_0042470945 /DNA_START=95 /DNA_END=532 /DNA_ORIENTATION=+
MGYGIAGATLSGILFGAAWWMFIDGCSHSNDVGGVNTVEFLDSLPMTGATIFFILLISFQWDRLDAEDFEYSGCSNVAAWARICLFFDIMIGFGSCIGSGLLLTTRWMKDDRQPYFGVMQLIGTILIFVSAVIWRVGRNAAADPY